MSNRLCHHCAVPLNADECLHYVFECHACVVAEYDLEVSVRRDPAHPDADRLAQRPVVFHVTASARRRRTGLRIVAGAKAA